MKEGVKAMLFELLTEKEKEMMLNYIDAYAGGRSEDQHSLDYILRYWEKNKQDLFKLLGNKLIYSVPYSGREPEERLILKVKDDRKSILIMGIIALAISFIMSIVVTTSYYDYINDIMYGYY